MIYNDQNIITANTGIHTDATSWGLLVRLLRLLMVTSPMHGCSVRKSPPVYFHYGRCFGTLLLVARGDADDVIQ